MYIVSITRARLCTNNNNKMDLPEVWKPFDELGSVVLIEFDVWKVHFEDSRTWITHPKEH